MSSSPALGAPANRRPRLVGVLLAPAHVARAARAPLVLRRAHRLARADLVPQHDAETVEPQVLAHAGQAGQQAAAAGVAAAATC